jgi:hypothetical protein
MLPFLATNGWTYEAEAFSDCHDRAVVRIPHAALSPRAPHHCRKVVSENVSFFDIASF